MSAVDKTASSMSALSARPSLTRSGGLFSGVVAGDDAGAAVIGHIGPGPIDEDGEPVAKADQEPDMGEAPGEPGGETGETKAAEIGDRRLAADGREIAVVAIGEERLRGPVYCGANRPHRVMAHLLGGRSDTRNPLPHRIARGSGVADHE